MQNVERHWSRFLQSPKAIFQDFQSGGGRISLCSVEYYVLSRRYTSLSNQLTGSCSVRVTARRRRAATSTAAAPVLVLLVAVAMRAGCVQTAYAGRRPGVRRTVMRRAVMRRTVMRAVTAVLLVLLMLLLLVLAVAIVSFEFPKLWIIRIRTGRSACSHQPHLRSVHQ